MYFNAHCHLELSALGGKIPGGLSFPDWLARLVEERRRLTEEDIHAGIAHGIERMIETGTTALADCLASDRTAAPLREAAKNRVLQVHLYREILEFKQENGEEAVPRALIRQTETSPDGGLVIEGLAPHAPYTTTETLLRTSAAAASTHNQWLCIHAAEVPEEREMLVSGTGHLREFVAPFLDPRWSPPGMGPIQWLDFCGCLGPRTLLVHCNDIDEKDLRLIAQRGASVVVCPGSHIWFGRGRFPLGSLIDHGIKVYLGTDSLASNDDLDMEREIRLACELTPGVDEGIIRNLASADRFREFISSA